MFANSEKAGTVFTEGILENNMQARQRAAEIGDEHVINGTIGSLTDKGVLVTFPSVDGLLSKLDIKKVSAYTPMFGTEPFQHAMERLCFEEFVPKKRYGSAAVAGGLAGIRQAIVNYSEMGEAVVTSDWHWGPYNGITREEHRTLSCYELFEDRSFNLNSFIQTINQVSKSQKSVFIIFNSPAHNPTGSSLSLKEWDQVFAYLNTLKSRIIIFLDMAYMDFSSRNHKKLFQKIDGLESHVFTIINYTISKSLAKYGFRTAALIGIHEDQEAVREFRDSIAMSNRGCYGSVNSMGQYLTAALVADEALLKQYYKEKEVWKKVLQRRADAFLKYIDPDIVTPYESGFFVSVRSDSPKADLEKLKKENIFLVPMKLGVRLAVCSVEEEKMQRVAEALNGIRKS